MKITHVRLSPMTAAAALLLCIGYGTSVQAQDSGGTSPDSRAQCQAHARPEIERQRGEAEQETQKTLDREAIAAIEETKKAVKACADGKTDEALAAIERAVGKINVLTARNPSITLIPVDLLVEVIDTAPRDIKAIKELAKATQKAMDDKDYPAARVFLGSLVSEIRIRTYNLPLGTYPIAMNEAARLLDQKKTAEAHEVLMLALNTLVVIDRVRPLPVALAQVAINQAHTLREKDKDTALKHLTTAKNEFERAKELGYEGKDAEYASMSASISDLEKQLKGSSDTASAFAKLKEKVAAFFKRHSDGQKKSETSA